MKKVIIMMMFIGLFTVAYGQNYSSSASTQGTLTVTVTTSATTGGAFIPRNIVAIWIQDNSGNFVKSLLVYAAAQIQWLTNWNTASAGNKVDAITGATQSSHGVRMCTWNGTNVSNVVVADGTYTVKMELTDKDATGNLGTFTFVKGPTAQTQTPAAVPSFSVITLKWTPSIASGVEDVNMSNLYQVYPNPTSSSIFVNGLNIQEIEIFNASGERVLKTNLQNANLNSLPKGVYMIKIDTETGTIMKKLVKK